MTASERWGRSTPDTLVTDDAVVAAVAKYHENRDGSSFGFEFGGNVWAEVRLLAHDLNTRWGRVNGICRRMVEAGRLVQAPGGGSFFKLAEGEKRTRAAAAKRAQLARTREAETADEYVPKRVGELHRPIRARLLG